MIIIKLELDEATRIFQHLKMQYAASENQRAVYDFVNELEFKIQEEAQRLKDADKG